MAEWIPTAEEILKKEFDIEVKHIRAETTFKDQFYTVKQKGSHIGEIYGYPYIIGAWCNDRLKVGALNKYDKSLKDQVCHYIGIAFDEPERYKRIKAQETKIVQYQSVLYDNKITEQMAFDICAEYELISPLYSYGAFRGGCWFCVKQCMPDLYSLWNDFPEYFSMLLEMEKDSRIPFKPNTTLPELAARFESGYIPKRRKKRDSQ